MMQMEITGIAEDDVVLASAMLDDLGYRYDEDYTTLYGAGWAITGMRIMNPEACAIVAQALATSPFPKGTTIH